MGAWFAQECRALSSSGRWSSSSGSSRSLRAPIADIGGGTGVYASPLSQSGYEVTLVDAMDNHVDEARAKSESQPDHPFRAMLGDARSLDLDDEAFDGVLLLSPLYHLTDRDDRLTALAEAQRVVKPGGTVLAAGITRFASLLGGLGEDMLSHPIFRPIVERDLREGQHRNPDPQLHPEFFTTAYFHEPRELAAEAAEVGLSKIQTYGIEGAGWIAPWFESSEARRRDILFAARSVENEASLIGMSIHFMVVGRKP